jgi:hypothetical protein
MSCLVVMCAISVIPVITVALLYLAGADPGIPRASYGMRQQPPLLAAALRPDRRSIAVDHA